MVYFDLVLCGTCSNILLWYLVWCSMVLCRCWCDILSLGVSRYVLVWSGVFSCGRLVWCGSSGSAILSLGVV